MRASTSPRFVQVKVSILRRLEPFFDLIRTQSPSARPQRLSDALFDQWFESTDTIFLNTLPVQWSQRGNKIIDVEQRSARY